MSVGAGDGERRSVTLTRLFRYADERQTKAKKAVSGKSKQMKKSPKKIGTDVEGGSDSELTDLEDS